MYTAEELSKIAAGIVERGENSKLLMFADLMEDIGDIRAPAVRNHAYCCARGIGIVEHFSYTGEVIDKEELYNIKNYDSTAKTNDPNKWGCMPPYQ